VRPGPAAAALAALLALSVLPPAPSWAARPLDTEDTGTLDPGQADLELSANLARQGDGDAAGGKAVLAVGLWPGLEVRLESTLLVLDPAGEPARAGAGDSLLGIKYRLLDEAPAVPATLVGLTLRLPTGDASRALGTEGFDVGAVAVASKTLGAVVLTGNAGYTVVTQDRAADFWTLAASLEYRTAAAWSLVSEAVAMLPAGGPGAVVLRAGGVWGLAPRIALDGAVGVGLTPASSDVTITVGVTFGLLRPGPP
jgi:hypothetical protein